MGNVSFGMEAYSVLVNKSISEARGSYSVAIGSGPTGIDILNKLEEELLEKEKHRILKIKDWLRKKNNQKFPTFGQSIAIGNIITKDNIIKKI